MPNTECITNVVEELKTEGIQTSEEKVAEILDKLQEEGWDELNEIERGLAFDKIIDDNTEAVNFTLRNEAMKLRAELNFFTKANEIRKVDPKADVTNYDVLEADLVGSNANLPGYRNSVDARTESVKAQYVGNFLYELDEAGLTKLVTSNKYNADNVAKELYAMTPDDTIGAVLAEVEARGAKQPYDVYEGFDSRISGDKEAYAIAKIMAKSQIEMVRRANRAGAHIEARNDYIVRQSHNPEAIKKAKFEKWRSDIEPLLDEELTFKDVPANERDDFFQTIYNNILYGKMDNLGSANLRVGVANKLSRARVLHFNDAEAFMQYNKIYGKKELMDTYLSTVNSMSRDIAMMEKFGPNPDSTFDSLLAKIAKDYMVKLESGNIPDGKLKNKIDKQMSDKHQRKLRHQYNEVSGKTNIPVIGKLGSFGRNLRAAHNMSKLGGSAISAMADAGFFPFEASYQGMGFTRSFLKGISTPVIEPLKLLFRGKTRRQQQQLARQIGIGMDYITSSAMERFTVDDGFSGRVGNAQKKFFKLNGLTWITDAFKTSFAMMASNNLGVKRDMDYGMLGGRLKSVLSKYDIKQADWNLIRQTAELDPNDKNWYITPDKIRYLTDQQIADSMGLARLDVEYAKDIRDKLETSLRAYFVDRADFASPTPGAKERAYMYRSAPPGSREGELLRFFWQFKSFSMTVLTKIWGREVTGGYNNVSAVGRMAGMLALTTTTGLVAYSVKEVLKGEVPKVLALDPDDMEPLDIFNIVGAGFAQGGGGGIYADLLFSTNTRYGQSLLETVGGPTASMLSDLGRVFGHGWSGYEQAAMGKDVDIGERAAQAGLRVVKSLTPGGNLPGIKPTLDAYVWYRMNEALNPGYMRRLRRHKRKDGTEYWAEPEARYIEDDIQDLFN